MTYTEKRREELEELKVAYSKAEVYLREACEAYFHIGVKAGTEEYEHHFDMCRFYHDKASRAYNKAGKVYEEAFISYHRSKGEDDEW